MFGVKQAELLQPSSRRELLAALLADLKDSHWTKAVRCSPSPAFMVPLRVETALQQHVVQLSGSSIERAAAAALKRLQLLPDCEAARLDYALLLYFTGRYEDAWLELGMYVEALNDSVDEKVAIFNEKLRLELAMKA